MSSTSFFLDDDTHAFLEHELAVVDGPEADVHRDVLEIHRDVLHEGFLQCLNEALVREDHAVGEEHNVAKKHRGAKVHAFVDAVQLPAVHRVGVLLPRPDA